MVFVARIRSSWRTLVYLAASACGSILIIQTSFTRYNAGESDHLVLSPAGFLRADPSLYLNDYFVPNAKMPHWMFEFYTAFAYSIGQVGPMYFLYWLATVCVFAYGQLIIARQVVNEFTYSLALLVMTLQLVGVRVMFGTSSILLNQALPHSFGASLGMVVIALLMKGRIKPLFVLLVFLPLIHIQIGTIAVGIVIVYVLLERIRGIGITLFETLTISGSLVSVLFGLSYRPVAGNVKDFSQLCQDLAPWHCYAPSWSGTVIFGSVLIVLLGFFGGLFIAKDVLTRSIRISVLILPAVFLLLSLLLDRYDIGILADFVRGNNAYRVAAVLLPWLYWIPIFLVASKKVNVLYRIGAAVVVTALLRLVTLYEHGNYFEGRVIVPLFIFTLIFAVVWFDRRYVKRTRGVSHFLLVFVACLPTLSLLIYGNQSYARPQIAFLGDPFFQGLGKALRDDVMPGQVVVGNPTLSWLRVASGVGYGVDCNFRPLGGGPPLQEYYRRISPLGSYQDVCDFDAFARVDFASLEKYFSASAGDVLLIPENDNRIPQLIDVGWTVSGSDNVRNFGFVLLSPRNDS